MKKFDKYITSRNVAIFGTITAHMVLFALFTHFSLSTDLDREQSELVINFIETETKVEENEEEILEEENTPETKVNIYEQFAKTLTNQASNQASKEKVEELRESMKSIDNGDTEKDLFSDEALKRDIKIEKESESNLGSNEEVSKETSYTGKSTINYFLKDRYSVRLPNPIYTCIDGGLIYIDIKVNKEGVVTDANYNKSKSNSSNDCLIETALKYAKMSRFNTDFKNSPSSQKGYITYLFQKN